jgi:spore coat protein H
MLPSVKLIYFNRRFLSIKQSVPICGTCPDKVGICGKIMYFLCQIDTLAFRTKALCLLFAFLLATISSSIGQTIEGIKLEKPAGPSQINTFSFTLPASRLKRLHEARGEKFVLDVPSIIVNGDTLKTEHVRIRGTSSSYLRRKSLNIKLHKPGRIYSKQDTLSLKKLFAVSMNMDRNYIRNRLSLQILGDMNIAAPPGAYSNLLINGASEGLYMVFDPPEEFAMKERGATLVLRRGTNGTAVDVAFEGIENKEVTLLKRKFQSVYTEIIRRHSGADLYQKLGEILDLNGYFTWLAYNHLFQNGDYTDELFVMWNKTANRFEVIPWDFDDLLLPGPHEGFEKRNPILGDKLIFSSEDALDVKIAHDEFLYKQYLTAYKALLEKLTPAALADILNTVYQEVYPYYVQPEIIGQSQYDQSGATDLAKLEEDMQSIAQFVNTRRVIYLGKITEMLKD